MSMKSYAIFQPGALIFDEDFEPEKLILAVDRLRGRRLSEETVAALKNGVFTASARRDIQSAFGIPAKLLDSADSYSYVSEWLLDNKAAWAESGAVFNYASNISAGYFSEIDGEFQFDRETPAEFVSECLMFFIDALMAWDVDAYSGARNKGDVAALLREAAKPLLRHDIDWESRLGVLVGTDFC